MAVNPTFTAAMKPVQDFRLADEPDLDEEPQSSILGPDGKPAEQSANSDSKTLRLSSTGLTSKQTAFLVAFIDHGTLSHAAEASGISRAAHYDWVRDPVYQRAFEVAKEAAADNLEREAIRRAVEGVEEPVGWYQGRPGGFVRRRSDGLLVLLLKAWLPEKYKERFEQKSIHEMDFTKLSSEQLEALAQQWIKQATGNDPALAEATRKQLEERVRVIDGTAEVVEDKGETV